MGILTIASFVFFTGLVGVITWFLTRRDDHGSSDGYFLAGRTLTGGYIAGSLMLTNLSTEQLVGLNGDAFTDGICVMAWEVIAAASLVVMALLFLPKYLKSGIATVPQFFEKRFDSGTRAITTLIFLFAYAAILLPIILYTGATGLSKMLEVDKLTGIESESVVLWGTVWLIGIIGSIYAIFGGLRTVAVSDTINGFGLLVGGVLIVYFGLKAVNADGVMPALTEMRTLHPEKFNSIGGNEATVPFATLFSGVLLLNLFYWTTNQQIIQRTFGARNLAEGQKGVLYAGILKVLAPLILVLPGIIAFHLYSDDGIKQDHAYAHLVQNVLPDALTGFFAAAIVGAILSSFNSALNSTATLFSLGVYQGLVNPQADQKAVIRSGKIFGCVIAVVAMTVAPLLAGQKSIFGYLQQMNAIYFIPIFAVMVVGLTTKRVPATAAKVGLVFAFATIILGYFVPPFTGYAQLIHNFHFIGAVFVASIVIMLIIGKISPRETPWEHKDSGDVDLTPWPLAWPLGIGLVVFVLAIYAWFADFSILAG